MKDELAAKERTLESLNERLNQIKKEHDARRAERALREKALLEKEFELKEIENEKQLRSQDTKAN